VLTYSSTESEDSASANAGRIGSVWCVRECLGIGGGGGRERRYDSRCAALCQQVHVCVFLLHMSVIPDSNAHTHTGDTGGDEGRGKC